MKSIKELQDYPVNVQKLGELIFKRMVMSIETHKLSEKERLDKIAQGYPAMFATHAAHAKYTRIDERPEMFDIAKAYFESQQFNAIMGETFKQVCLDLAELCARRGIQLL